MIEVINPASLKLRSLEFEFADNQPDKALKDYVKAFDIFPVVLISNSDTGSGNTLEPSSINHIKIFNNKFLPEIEMICTDEQGTLIDNFFPLDYDITLSIFVKSTSENTLPIRMDFKIIEYNPLQSVVPGSDSASPKKFFIKGALDVDELYYTKFESFPNETSYNVLKTLSERMELGFATNTTNTDDNMNWINPANTNLEFMKNVTERAYISDNTFVWSFIDFYYRLNFVDIEKELNESPKDTQSINSSSTEDDGEEHIVELYLTTSDNLKLTNKYISSFNLKNQSSKININNGYQRSSRWFNKTDNTIEHSLIREFETPDDNLIQLITNEDISSKNWSESFQGKIDEDNVHKNYHLASTLNKFNISKLHKVTMTIILKKINFEVKRFQNLMIDFFDVNLLKDDDGVKAKLSGYWFVTGINYNYKKNGGGSQEITLVRRDLNLTHTQLHDIRKELNK